MVFFKYDIVGSIAALALNLFLATSAHTVNLFFCFCHLKKHNKYRKALLHLIQIKNRFFWFFWNLDDIEYCSIFFDSSILFAQLCLLILKLRIDTKLRRNLFVNTSSTLSPVLEKVYVNKKNVIFYVNHFKFQFLKIRSSFICWNYFLSISSFIPYNH